MKYLLPLFFLFTFSTAYADNYSDEQTVAFQLTIPETPNAFGTVTVLRKSQGPEYVILRLFGLPPKLRLNVFLANSSTLGAVPTSFLSEIRIGNDGNQISTFSTEVQNSYIITNPQTDLDLDGIVDEVGAGLAGGGAVQVPTPFFRLYFFDRAGPTLFADRAGELGGLLAGTTLIPINFIKPK